MDFLGEDRMKKLITIFIFVFGLHVPVTYAGLAEINAALDDTSSTFYDDVVALKQSGESLSNLMRALVKRGVSARLMAGIFKAAGYSQSVISQTASDVRWAMFSERDSDRWIVGAISRHLYTVFSTTTAILIVDGGSSAGVGVDISGA